MEVRRAIFEVKLRTARRPGRRRYQSLMRNQQLPPCELAKMENERAREIVEFAAAASPFYQRLYIEHGVQVGEADHAEVWASIPIIERSTVKANTSDFPTPEADGNSRDAQTGGSTGEPLRIQHDARVSAIALSWRMYSWWGVAPHDNIARIGRWGFGWREQLRNDLSWWPTRQVYLDAALIDRRSMETFHNKVSAARPSLLEGYVGAMLEFADFIETRRLKLPRFKAVATTAAPLTEAIRTRLQDVFKAPVYDEYRGSELGWMAGECTERTGLHIFSDMRRIEVVSGDGEVLPPGAVGDLVVTDLTNRVFPIIRYRVGDRGMLLEHLCSCGRSLPLMAKPDGRTTDILRLPSGAVLAHRLMALFSAVPAAVRLFQIHQRADFSITVRVVLGEAPDARVQVERATQVLRERIANEVRVTVEYVDALPYTGGKTKYIISEVARVEPDGQRLGLDVEEEV